MKKYPQIFVILILVLSTTACSLPVNIPFLNRSTESAQEGVSPAPTATQIAQPLGDGFEVYSANGVEIVLPETYVLGDVKEDLSALVQNLIDLGGEINIDIQKILENNLDDVHLWAYDVDGSTNRQTHFFAAKNERFSKISLGMISTFAKMFLGDMVDTMTHERLTLGGRDILRFNVNVAIEGVETTQAVYLFKDSGKLWVLGFFSNQQQAGGRLADYDAAVSTFTVLSVE